jgi:hypothetical protein
MHRQEAPLKSAAAAMFVPPWKLKSKGLCSAPATLLPLLYLNAARGFFCRFFHPRWPKRLLPVLISGLQSTPTAPTRHAPYEWLIQLLIARCPVRFPFPPNAPLWLLLVLAGGAVAFLSRPQSVGSPIACGFCSFHHCPAQD